MLTIAIKYEITVELESAASLAKKYGIGESTITDIKERKRSIENLCQARSREWSRSRKLSSIDNEIMYVRSLNGETMYESNMLKYIRCFEAFQTLHFFI